MRRTLLTMFAFFLTFCLLVSCSNNTVSQSEETPDVLALYHSLVVSTNQNDNSDTNFATSKSIESFDYILNIDSKKFHFPYCRSVKIMNEENKYYYFGERDEVIQKGYNPCGHCCP